MCQLRSVWFWGLNRHKGAVKCLPGKCRRASSESLKVVASKNERFGGAEGLLRLPAVTGGCCLHPQQGPGLVLGAAGAGLVPGTGHGDTETPGTGPWCFRASLLLLSSVHWEE